MLWFISTSAEVSEAVESATTSVPERFAWRNLGELQESYTAAINSHPGMDVSSYPSLAFDAVPTPMLEINDPSWTFDALVVMVLTFASKRLRAAMALGPDIIRYRPIDASLSVPEVRALDYQAMDAVQVGNPFDPNRLAGEVRDNILLDGTTRREWVPTIPNVPGRPFTFYLRDDFVPPAPIFRALGTRFVLATEEFADRVMRLGITDMTFQDGSTPGLSSSQRLRRPR